MTSGLFDVSGRRVLVTGGARGLGLVIARGFVERGANVYVSSREDTGPAAVAAELASSGPGSCVALRADLTTEDGCRGLAEAYAAHENELDVLVNNAGTTAWAPLEEHGDEVWDRLVSINLKAVFHVTRFMLPFLRAASGSTAARVINIGSVAGIGVLRRENYSYTSTKAAALHLTRHLALQLAPDVLVNAIAPGLFPAGGSARLLSEEQLRELASHALLGRTGETQDLVGAAVFLASPASAFITGVVLPIDGGQSMTVLG